ncbi:TonB-dependent receptor [Glacieibacterium sp.]|uniref:TonB-dependent receptor n=1 Tax=Glacieibacterium sp. TaxID=2860237 RepID=UPI003AFF83F6
MTSKLESAARAVFGLPLIFIAAPVFGQEAAPAASPASVGPATDNASEITDIVVTAQRRDSSLQRTPVSITALDSSALTRLQITDTKQIVFNAPNLTGNSNVGQSSATSFFIRGVGTSENLATADTSVGLYVDDVYISRQSVNNFAMYDVERVEVLRGPQGTLYGRNTNGGAIKIINKKPNDEAEFVGSASYGNYNRYELKLNGNIPISDKTYVRATYLTQQGDGYIYNRTLDKHVNDQDFMGGRVALRTLPTDTLDVTISADYARDKQNGGYSSDVAGVLRPTTGSLLQVVSGTDNRTLGRTYGAAGTINWEPANGITVQSITAWRSTTQNIRLDLSDQPVSLYTLTQRQDAKQFSQELKLDAKITDRLSLLTGLYYFDESIDAFLSDVTRATSTATPSSFAKTFKVDTTSFAAYGELEYKITDKLVLAASGRFTHERKTLDITQVSSLPGAEFNFNTASLLANAAATGNNFDDDRKFNKFTPKIGLNWTVTPDFFAYASYTKGFRSGGWTGRATRQSQYLDFDPETVSSYEVGTKLTAFDRRLRLNTSFFFMDYKNLFNTLTSNGQFIALTTAAKIYGLENELTFRATPWLDLYVNGGLLKTEYKGDRSPNLADRLQRAPAVQGKAGFSVMKPLGAGNLLVNGGLFYTAHYLITPAFLPFTAPRVPADSNRTGGFVLVDVSLGYSWGDEGRFKLVASCTNCANKSYFDSTTIIGGWAGNYSGPPRFYKLTGTVRF